MAGWLCGGLALWWASSVVGWLCGRLALWWAGSVVDWLRGPPIDNMETSLEGTLFCSPYCASLLPYFVVGLSSELPVHSYPSLLLSAAYVPCESPSRPLHTSSPSTPALSYLDSHLPALSLAHWVDLFLARGGFWHLSGLPSSSLQQSTLPSPRDQ